VIENTIGSLELEATLRRLKLLSWRVRSETFNVYLGRACEVDGGSQKILSSLAVGNTGRSGDGKAVCGRAAAFPRWLRKDEQYMLRFRALARLL
jgi:hypothetical protein